MDEAESMWLVLKGVITWLFSVETQQNDIFYKNFSGLFVLYQGLPEELSSLSIASSIFPENLRLTSNLVKFKSDMNPKP